MRGSSGGNRVQRQEDMLCGCSQFLHMHVMPNLGHSFRIGSEFERMQPRAILAVAPVETHVPVGLQPVHPPSGGA
jgi:hypothetical protein